MALINFEYEEDNTITKENIKEGFHLGTIINSKEDNSTFDGVESKIFIIVWEIRGLNFYDRFKLWDTFPTKRGYAQERFKNLCEVLDLKLPYDDSNKQIQFDSDLLMGKQADVFIKRFTDKDGIKRVFIHTHKKAGSASIYNREEVWEPRKNYTSPFPSKIPETNLLDDEIPF